jgi:hypothetical protein
LRSATDPGNTIRFRKFINIIVPWLIFSVPKLRPKLIS